MPRQQGLDLDVEVLVSLSGRGFIVHVQYAATH
jgi:hypothetical protein